MEPGTLAGGAGSQGSPMPVVGAARVRVWQRSRLGLQRRCAAVRSTASTRRVGAASPVPSLRATWPPRATWLSSLSQIGQTQHRCMTAITSTSASPSSSRSTPTQCCSRPNAQRAPGSIGCHPQMRTLTPPLRQTKTDPLAQAHDPRARIRPATTAPNSRNATRSGLCQCHVGAHIQFLRLESLRHPGSAIEGT